MKKTLEEFCREVNTLARKQCDKINASKPKRLFGAVHHELPESMLRYYFGRGYSVAQTWASIKAEGRAQ